MERLFMVGPLTRCVGRWLAILLLLLPAASATASPAVPERIVAVGDLHGDFDAWQAIARGARLIDSRGHWAGGKATLVQTGDIVDRGPDSFRIIRHLQQLEREARKAGGEVIVLVGNHEAMMMTGDLRYVTPGEYAAFADANSERRRDRLWDAQRKAIIADYRKTDVTLSDTAIRERWYAATPLGMIEHQTAWAPTGELGKWLMEHKAVVQIGDTIFVHGGISPAYAPVSDNDINRQVAQALAARDTGREAIINSAMGPLWYRGLAGLPPETPVRGAPPLPSVSVQLDRLLSLRKARRIVIGHTPILSGVTVQEAGRLGRVDSGASRAYGGKPGYLEIIGGKATAHSVSRP